MTPVDEHHDTKKENLHWGTIKTLKSSLRWIIFSSVLPSVSWLFQCGSNQSNPRVASEPVQLFCVILLCCWLTGYMVLLLLVKSPCRSWIGEVHKWPKPGQLRVAGVTHDEIPYQSTIEPINHLKYLDPELTHRPNIELVDWKWMPPAGRLAGHLNPQPIIVVGTVQVLALSIYCPLRERWANQSTKSPSQLRNK